MTLPSATLIAPVASGLGIQLTRTSMQENIGNPGVQTASVLAFLDRFPDVDIVFPVMDTSVEARALGCPSEFRGRVPVISSHPFSGPEALHDLAVPDPQSCGPMAANIEVIARLNRETGKKTAAFVVGPVTLAAHLMGVTGLVRLFRRDAAALEDVLDL